MKLQHLGAYLSQLHFCLFRKKVFLEEIGRDGLLTASARKENARCYRVHIKTEFIGPKFGKSESENTLVSVWGASTAISGGEKTNVCLSYWCLTPGR